MTFKQKFDDKVNVAMAYKTIMAKHFKEYLIITILIVGILILYFCNKLVVTSDYLLNINSSYEWIIKGFVNILGYSTIVIPGYMVYVYVKKSDYLERSGGGLIGRIIRMCFGEDEIIDRTVIPTIDEQRTPLQDTCLLLFYFTGLQVSFLSWGVLQEKVMTQKYTNGTEEGNFKDSQFLVFVNRVLAFLMSGTVVLCTRQPRHRCPLYKYIFCSLSNILSSWCQYEVLKYVSFPHQVLAKASKTIPVMIMGKIVSRTKYKYHEYATAVILSIGMLFFLLDMGTSKSSPSTTFSGFILLCLYILFDSFTSNWQGALFKQFSVSPVQMMCAVNLFSCTFTAISLLQQGSFMRSFNFMLNFPSFILDCILLSFCSAAGQLFIFKTLSVFGPLVFAIISTFRQGFSVLLSCLIYKHHINFLGIFGIILVFFSLFLRIYCSYRIKSTPKAKPQSI